MEQLNMTTKQLNKLTPGTYVIWTRPGEYMCGVVSARPDMNNQTPHYIIDWADGQQTDGRDDAAICHVEVCK